jgi:hypothetical protein
LINNLQNLIHYWQTHLRRMFQLRLRAFQKLNQSKKLSKKWKRNIKMIKLNSKWTNLRRTSKITMMVCLKIKLK